MCAWKTASSGVGWPVMGSALHALAGNQVERHRAVAVLRQRADMDVEVGADVRALDLQHMLRRIARGETEGTAGPAADALDRRTRREVALHRLAVVADGDRYLVAAADVEAERRMVAVLDADRQQLLDDHLAADRRGEVFDEDQDLVVGVTLVADLREDLDDGFAGFSGDHGDVGNAVALDKKLKRLHWFNPLFWSRSPPWKPGSQRVNRAAAGKPESAHHEFLAIWILRLIWGIAPEPGLGCPAHFA